MLIYILHSNKIDTFRLPKGITGDYFVQYQDVNGNSKNLINVYSENDKIYIKSNDFARILNNNKYIDSCELVIDKFYLIQTVTNEAFIIYAAPAYDNSFVTKEIADNTSILIGKDTNCEIIYTSQNIADKQVQLVYKNKIWYVKNLYSKVPIYYNNKSVIEEKIGNFGVLFIMGLKIVVFGHLAFINNPGKKIQFLPGKLNDKKKFSYAVSNVNTQNQVFTDFYSPDEYFVKSPVFVKKNKTLELDIVNPNPKEQKTSSSMLFDMVPSLLMCSTSLLSAFYTIKDYRAGKADKESFYTAILMCGLMLFISLIWPVIEYLAGNMSAAIKNYRRSSKYKKYLKRKEEVLQKAISDQKTTLIFNHLSLKECQDAILKKNSNLFSINSNHDRFLEIRLGVGRVKLDCNIDYDFYSGYENKDELQQKVEDMIEKYKYIDAAPFPFSLKNNVSFVNSSEKFKAYMQSILLQLITYYDYYNLKLIFLTSKNSYLHDLKNLNHCWRNDNSVRYVATTSQEAEIISSDLMRIIKERKEKAGTDKKPPAPHYLVISDDLKQYRHIKLIEEILTSEADIGFSCMFFAKRISDVPNNCKYFIEYNDTEATLFESEMNDENISRFKPEFITDDIDFSACVNILSNLPIVNNDIDDVQNNGMLPDRLGFLEMFGVGRVNQLNSIDRWKNSGIVNSLATPIGVDTTGSLLQLDLHEKAHGPHGLIAGMTGSGKSETIVTYLLSLATNYSPNEVQFVLIDYKGGGLAGAFENRKTGIKLPHLVGTITNLDKSSMNRTLVSIKSELQRRQLVFNSAKENLNITTIDIYKYQELVRNGLLEDPMSHLFIVCDEFAELKAQQPDFMDELISAARIGRSLGIHLILATQKPTGVVDDQIWSNSKFKICAKVQTAEDSQEMLRKSDAAYIKESGRFYLQVGYDEIYVKAQSAYTGVKYVPTNNAVAGSSENEEINFVDDIGNTIKTTKEFAKQEQTTEDLGDELGNVIKYLIECAEKIEYTNKQLWLENVPDNIYFEDLINKYSYKEHKCVIDPLIGEYDDPGNQKQDFVDVDITRKGNLWISGVVGSGRTTLLSTIIYSTIINHSTDEVNIFIMDFLAETLKKFSNAPQVADVIVSADKEKVEKIFYYLSNEVSRRKRILSKGGKNFQSYLDTGKIPFPNILVVINGFDSFYESSTDLCDEIFIPLVRDSGRVGINFIITSAGDLNNYILSNFPQKIALKHLEASDYGEIFENLPFGLLPKDTPGRGLIELDNVYEFQVAQLDKEDSVEDKLKYIIDKLREALPKAEGIPTMPRVVSAEILKDGINTLKDVPIGMETKSNCAFAFNFDHLVNLVLYGEKSYAQAFENGLINVINRIDNTKVVWLDALDVAVNDEISNITKYSKNFVSLCKSLNKTITDKKSADDNAEKIVFVISGYSVLQKHLKQQKKSKSEVKTIDDLIMSAVGGANYKFILLDSASTRSIDSALWIDYFDYGRGIILGRDPDDQEIIDCNEIFGDTKYSRDIAVVVNDGYPTIVKYVRK